jgi:hypothetical protein
MLRLRKRLPAVGLTVRTIRSRGYLLDRHTAAGTKDTAAVGITAVVGRAPRGPVVG